MHEAMVAQSIFETITAEAQKQQARPIAARISCGQLNPINEEVLNFAFEAAAKGTICEGTRLKVVEITLKCTCKKCGRTHGFDIYSSGCPGCGSSDFDINPDAPLLLEEIEFEDN